MIVFISGLLIGLIIGFVLGGVFWGRTFRACLDDGFVKTKDKIYKIEKIDTWKEIFKEDKNETN